MKLLVCLVFWWLMLASSFLIAKQLPPHWGPHSDNWPNITSFVEHNDKLFIAGQFAAFAPQMKENWSKGRLINLESNKATNSQLNLGSFDINNVYPTTDNNWIVANLNLDNNFLKLVKLNSTGTVVQDWSDLLVDITINRIIFNESTSTIYILAANEETLDKSNHEHYLKYQEFSLLALDVNSNTLTRIFPKIETNLSRNKAIQTLDDRYLLFTYQDGSDWKLLTIDLRDKVTLNSFALFENKINNILDIKATENNHEFILLVQRNKKIEENDHGHTYYEPTHKEIFRLNWQNQSVSSFSPTIIGRIESIDYNPATNYLYVGGHELSIDGKNKRQLLVLDTSSNTVINQPVFGNDVAVRNVQLSFDKQDLYTIWHKGDELDKAYFYSNVDYEESLSLLDINSLQISKTFDHSGEYGYAPIEKIIPSQNDSYVLLQTFNRGIGAFPANNIAMLEKNSFELLPFALSPRIKNKIVGLRISPNGEYLIIVTVAKSNFSYDENNYTFNVYDFDSKSLIWKANHSYKFSNNYGEINNFESNFDVNNFYLRFVGNFYLLADGTRPYSLNDDDFSEVESLIKLSNEDDVYFTAQKNKLIRYDIKQRKRIDQLDVLSNISKLFIPSNLDSVIVLTENNQLIAFDKTDSSILYNQQLGFEATLYSSTISADESQISFFKNRRLFGDANDFYPIFSPYYMVYDIDISDGNISNQSIVIRTHGIASMKISADNQYRYLGNSNWLEHKKNPNVIVKISDVSKLLSHMDQQTYYISEPTSVQLQCDKFPTSDCSKITYQVANALQHPIASVYKPYSDPIYIDADSHIKFFPTAENGEEQNANSVNVFLDLHPPVAKAKISSPEGIDEKFLTFDCTDEDIHSGCVNIYYTTGSRRTR